MTPTRSTLGPAWTCLVALAVLSGCGGGGDQAEPPGALALAEAVAATERSRILAVTPEVDTPTVLDWIEFTFPTLFAKGPVSFDVALGDTTFTARGYPHAQGTRYIGISRDGAIYGLGDFTADKLQAFGSVADVATLIRRDRCALNPGNCDPASVGLAPELLDLPSHPDCASLRSGRQRFITPQAASTGDPLIQIVEVDAPKLTLTFADGRVARGSSTGGCTFRFAADFMRMVVSRSGLAALTTSGTTQKLSLMFPEQQARLADLQGRWNWLNFNTVSAPLRALSMQTSEAAVNGRFTALADCALLGACTPVRDTLPVATLNAEGGFDLARGAAQVPLRVFSFRPANGQPVLVAVNSQALQFAARAASTPLPTLGDTWRRMDLAMNAQGLADSAFTFSTYSAVAVDVPGSGYTRRRSEDGVVQRFDYNRPRAGLLYRAAGSASNLSGGVTAFNEIHVLPLTGTGVFIYSRPSTDITRNLGSMGITLDVDAAAVGGNGSTGQRP